MIRSLIPAIGQAHVWGRVYLSPHEARNTPPSPRVNLSVSADLFPAHLATPLIELLQRNRNVASYSGKDLRITGGVSA
jgi:hypothetical protein